MSDSTTDVLENPHPYEAATEYVPRAYMPGIPVRPIDFLFPAPCAVCGSEYGAAVHRRPPVIR